MTAEINVDLAADMENPPESGIIRKLRVLIGENSRTKHPEDAETLSIYLEMAGDKILERLYPYREDRDGLEIPSRYQMLQLKIAAYLLNKRGAEGEVQHIENGVHRNYGDADIPEAMLSSIAPFIGIPK